MGLYYGSRSGATLSAAYIDTFHVRSKDTSLFRVRVTVIDPEGEPVEYAKVWSSVGGEPKRVSGGWEFDIPEATKPSDGRLSLFAAQTPAYSPVRADLVLENNYFPTVVLQLRKGPSATVQGVVIDALNQGIEGAIVRIVGYEEEAKTRKDGHFLLNSHVTDGQQVLLHIEKHGYAAVEQYQPAGNEPAVIVLSAH